MTPTIRLAQSLFVAYIGVFGLLTAFGNITDYGSNFAFVQHVMSMDTIFPESHLHYRAITSPAFHHAAYWLIILVEALIGAILAFASVRLALALRGPAARFAAAKHYTVIGVGLGFLLWFTGFAVVGGEWFDMWQSKDWNGVPSAFRFYVTLLAVAIFLTRVAKEGNRNSRIPCRQLHCAYGPAL